MRSSPISSVRHWRSLPRCHAITPDTSPAGLDIAIAYATSILGDRALAEDAAQESFLQAYRSLSSLREPGAFPAWFRRIVFKQCDRATRRHRHRLAYSDVAAEVADPAPSAEERLEREQRQRSLRAAIATLAMPEQQVILLYYMGEQSQSVIASFLGVTTNTIKTTAVLRTQATEGAHG